MPVIEMWYCSSNNPYNEVDLFCAVTQSMANDGGVYVPKVIPVIPQALFNNIAGMSAVEVANIVAVSLFGSDIEYDALNGMVRNTINFDIPLVKVADKVYSLELFHGPTRSFKDIGVRFLAQLLAHYQKSKSAATPNLNVLVTTSGDTGYAVSDAFGGIDGVTVYILYPSSAGHLFGEKLSPNIIPIEVKSDYDTCVNLAQETYADKELNRKMMLTSANTLNIARLLPQTFIFFWAYSRLLAEGERTERIVVSTPCGNLGNLTAALYARSMGLPINRIISCGKRNSRLWKDFLKGSVNDDKTHSLKTNLARINAIMTQKADYASIVDCHTFDESQIDEIIEDTRNRFGYELGRNSAMGFSALMDDKEQDEIGIFLATSLETQRPFSKKIKSGRHSGSMAHIISPTYKALRKIILSNL